MTKQFEDIKEVMRSRHSIKERQWSTKKSLRIKKGVNRSCKLKDSHHNSQRKQATRTPPQTEGGTQLLREGKQFLFHTHEHTDMNSATIKIN